MRGLSLLRGPVVRILFLVARDCSMSLRITNDTDMTVSAIGILTFVFLEGVTLPSVKPSGLQRVSPGTQHLHPRLPSFL